MNAVKEYLESTFDKENPCLIRKRIKCRDGYTVSVQGGDYFHYCEPRIHENSYFNVELGYPSCCDEEILKYAENPDAPTETVYAYVPIEIVEELVEKHGGIFLRGGVNEDGKIK